MMKEEEILFFVGIGFVMAIMIFIIIISSVVFEHIQQKQWKARGCYKTTQQIGIKSCQGWQCKDGCFYYKIRNEAVCFKN